MALPERNASFQKGNIDGFARMGFVSVTTAFDASVCGGRLIGPLHIIGWPIVVSGTDGKHPSGRAKERVLPPGGYGHRS